MAASIHSFARVLPFPGEQRNSQVAGWPVPAERRLKFRYPLGLTVRFRSSSPVTPFSGEGIAVNLCSGGVLVATEHQITVGALVEMRIEWPSMIDGRIPLQLIAVGRILRRESSSGVSCFAATFERYEFRTHNLTQRTPNPHQSST
jgi:hypothetical protein